MSIVYDIVNQSGVTKVTSQDVLRNLEDEDLEGSFTLHVTHGHLIRSLVHVLRDILAYGILELTPNRLRLLRLDKTERIIVSIDIDTSRFFQYLFVSKKGVIRIGISFAVLWQCVKVIGKQDSFIMSKCDGDEFVILDFGNSAKQQYALQGVCDDKTITIPIYNSLQPNIFITVKEMTKSMSYLRTEREQAHIKGYRDRIIVETLNGRKIQRMGVSYDDVWRRIGISPEELVGMMKADPNISCSLHLNESKTGIAELDIIADYPKFSSDASKPTVDVVQSHLVLKSLSKVYTIAPNSSILATVEAGKPIRLVIPVGDYGTLTLYLLAESWSGGDMVIQPNEPVSRPKRRPTRKLPVAPQPPPPEEEEAPVEVEEPEVLEEPQPPVIVEVKKRKRRPQAAAVEPQS